MYFDGSNFGIFGDIYSLIDKFVFGSAIQSYLENTLPNLTPAQFANLDLVCSLFATIFTLLAVALPFTIVFIVIKLIFGGR